MKTPFKEAERFIQLRKVWNSKSWGDQIVHINEMILTPLITLFLLFLRQTDMFSVFSAVLSTYSAWKNWIEYQSLRFRMQEMFLITMKTGGPFIVTNDPTYMPYVYADATLRDDMRRQGSD